MLPLPTLLAVLSAAAFTAAQGVEVSCTDAAVFAQEAYDKCAPLKPNAAAYNSCACQPTSIVLGGIYNLLDICDPLTGFQSPLIKLVGCDGLQCTVGDAIAMRVFARCGLPSVPIPATPLFAAQESCLCTAQNRDFFALYDAAACSSVKVAPLCSGTAAPATSTLLGASASSVASAEETAPTKPATVEGTASTKPASANSVSAKTATAIATGSTASAVSSKNSAFSVAASACLVFGASLLF
ncbi:hypothetical protein BJ741DRAFT_610849 [Chytriomyces cf. hyalinus JEL632]|nr:hypothetical protein BJ741DRAFT_610849 [Chytriomyces cf. hyalinus JEL632]